MDDSRFNISEDGLTLTVVEAREHANITCRGVNTIGATNYTSRLHVAAGEWGAGESGAAQWFRRTKNQNVSSGPLAHYGSEKPGTETSNHKLGIQLAKEQMGTRVQ